MIHDAAVCSSCADCLVVAQCDLLPVLHAESALHSMCLLWRIRSAAVVELSPVCLTGKHPAP